MPTCTLRLEHCWLDVLPRHRYSIVKYSRFTTFSCNCKRMWCHWSPTKLGQQIWPQISCIFNNNLQTIIGFVLVGLPSVTDHEVCLRNLHNINGVIDQLITEFSIWATGCLCCMAATLSTSGILIFLPNNLRDQLLVVYKLKIFNND